MGTDLLPAVTMPQLSGGRARAQALMAPLGSVRGRQVRLDCRDLVAGTSSFADELVDGLLVRGQAAGLLVEYASGEFVRYLHDAATDHNVSAKLKFS